MAKRANPYSEDIIQQSKVYINMKQFNNNEDRLKKVYEKTLLKLFKGAKKSHRDNTHASNDNGGVLDKRDKMKQLFIDKNGTLSHSGTLVDASVCEKCSCGGASAQSCEYCETYLCDICVRHCDLCHHSYCGKCSIFGSEGTEICVSCYS